MDKHYISKRDRTRQTTFGEFLDKWSTESTKKNAVEEPKKSSENPDPDGLGSLAVLLKDIEMESWLKRRSRCPQCMFGDVQEGGECDTCGWQAEEEDELMKEFNFLGRPLIYKCDVICMKLWNRNRGK